MKNALLLITLIAGFGATSLKLHSQTPAPIAAVPAGGALEQLRAIRDQNAKLLQQQAATIEKLDELEKNSQTIKVLGRRS